MESQIHFEHLSTEILLKIFHYLNTSDLCRLRLTCKRFCEIISLWEYVLFPAPVVTNQRSSIFFSKCQRRIFGLEKYRISKNWKTGLYSQKTLLGTKKKYMPWLHLTDKYVWISRGKTIFCYERVRSSFIKLSNPKYVLGGRSKADIGHFQITNDFVLSGQRDGSMCLTSLEQQNIIFNQVKCHTSDINTVDISPNGNTIISGSRDETFKIWNVDFNSETKVCNEVYTKCLDDRVLRVSLFNDQMAIATSANNTKTPLYVYNIESIVNPKELFSTQIGEGILDIKWDGPHTLWTGGYDAYLRRWDLRTGSFEQSFCDPHGSVVYCLEHDHVNTVLTGTQFYGKVVLWDIRQRNAVQLYFMDSCNGRTRSNSSPVYSLSFDTESLFTATDRTLNVLNFSVTSGKPIDYSYSCRYIGC